MNLDDTQRRKIIAWIDEGLKLAEIQNRIGSEFGVRMTYMDVRLLVDDLKLTPKDTELPKPDASTLAAGNLGKSSAAQPQSTAPIDTDHDSSSGKVSVTVDQLTRPGAVVSGKVVFSDNAKADWYFDQTGRLGLAPESAGYRPPPADLQQFQMALESELSKLGF